MKRIGLLFGLLLAAGFGATGESSLVETTAYFEFHSDLRMSLHHFIYLWVTGEKSKQVPRPHDMPMPSKALRATLNAEDAAGWDEALDYYRSHVAGRPLLFDQELVAFKTWLRGGGGALSPRNQEMLRVLEKVEPIYRRVWWPAHDAANRAWVAQIAAQVRRTETETTHALAAIFGGTWPAGLVRVDVVPHAHELSAYTTAEPHLTISSIDPPSAYPRSLELLYHESSHADALEGALHRAITAAQTNTKLKAPRDLWHVIIFHTSGELVRRIWLDQGAAAPPLFLSEIAERIKSWKPMQAQLDRYWASVIDARGAGRVPALEAVLRGLQETSKN